MFWYVIMMFGIYYFCFLKYFGEKCKCRMIEVIFLYICNFVCFLEVSLNCFEILFDLIKMFIGLVILELK